VLVIARGSEKYRWQSWLSFWGKRKNIAISYFDEDSPAAQEVARTTYSYHDTGIEPMPD
jgi:hypothetical protein